MWSVCYEFDFKKWSVSYEFANAFHSQISTYYGERVMSQFTKCTNKGVTVCTSKKHSPKSVL